MVRDGCGEECTCTGRALQIIRKSTYRPNQKKIGLDITVRGEIGEGWVFDVDSPLRCYDERILLPHYLALGNRDLRDKSFPLFLVEIFVFDGCRPSGDVKTFDERGRWVNVRRIRPSSRRRT
jgi:hypothetical protein